MDWRCGFALAKCKVQIPVPPKKRKEKNYF
jgi:hypothetical protein